MNKEIDISKVPLTPTGVNHDFKAIRKYEFVRFDEYVRVRTRVLMDPDSYLSDNEVDLDLLETDEQKVEAIIKSPMIEVRKKRQSKSLDNGDIRFNPKRDDINETSLGCYNNYQQNRRKTIAVMKSFTPKKQDTHKTRFSLSQPISVISKKENFDPKKKLDKELDLLVAAVDHSQTLLDIERKRLSDLIVDWSHIIEIEKEIPLENLGDIESAIGGVQILLDKRFQSTLNLLDSAEKYVNSNGVPTEENKQHYRSGDIYGFVDLLIEEIKKIDGEFNKLLNLRNNNWISISPEITRKPKAPVVRTKAVNMKKKVKGRIDLALLRSKYSKTANKEKESVEMCVGLPDKVDDNGGNENNVENNQGKGNGAGEDNSTVDLSVQKTRISMKNNSRKSSLQLNPEIPLNTAVNNGKEITQINANAKDIEKETTVTPAASSKPTKRPKSILKSAHDLHLNTSNNERVTFVDISSTAGNKDNNEIDISINTSSNESSNIKTPPSSIKTGIRSKSVLKSNTGTPVHSDTPRPRRSCYKTNGFVMPSLSNVVSKKFPRKRSVVMPDNNEESLNTCPIPIPKKIRKSNQ